MSKKAELPKEEEVDVGNDTGSMVAAVVDGGAALSTLDKKTALLTRLSEHVSELSVDLADNIGVLVETLKPDQEGFGEMKNLYYRPPSVRVRQLMTVQAPTNVKNGELFSQDTGEKFESPLRFVPIYPYEDQARFPPGEAKPDCRSDDCEFNMSGDLCFECQDRPWRDGVKQSCNRSVNIIAASPDFRRLYHIQFSKTSTPSGKAVVQQTRIAGQRLWERIYELGTEEIKGKQGLYYKLTTSFTGEAANPAFFKIGRDLHDIMGAQREEGKERSRERRGNTSAIIDSVSTEAADLPGSGSNAADYDDL